MIQPLTQVLALRVSGEADGGDQHEAEGQSGHHHPREVEMRGNRGWPYRHLCKEHPPPQLGVAAGMQGRPRTSRISTRDGGDGPLGGPLCRLLKSEQCLLDGDGLASAAVLGALQCTHGGLGPHARFRESPVPGLWR